MRNSILKIQLFLFCTIMILGSCNKKDEDKTDSTNPTTNNTACQDGFVCFKLDGNSMSKAGGGYYFADTFVFVKYEDGTKQLSIDIFGSQTKDYTVGDKKNVDKARVYWFPDNSTMYMSSTGKLNVSELTTDKKIMGTFSGTLHKYENDTFSMTDSVVITEGFFTKIKLQQ